MGVGWAKYVHHALREAAMAYDLRHRYGMGVRKGNGKNDVYTHLVKLIKRKEAAWRHSNTLPPILLTIDLVSNTPLPTTSARPKKFTPSP